MTSAPPPPRSGGRSSRSTSPTRTADAITTLTDSAPPARWTPPAHATGNTPRLDRLAEHTPEGLAAQFAAGHAPETLNLLEGDPVCRGLVRGGRLVRRWAASSACSWIGKSFELAGEDELLGHNRLRLLGGSRALAFIATIGRSLHDGRPALILRYDDPRVPSPRWTHAIHDELREIDTGLLIGPAALRRSNNRLVTLCWFAIDTTAERPTAAPHATQAGHARSR
jgi:hypothetical protein